MKILVRIGVVAVLGIVGWIIQEVNSANRDDQGNISKSGEINAYDIQVGDCLAEIIEIDFSSTTGIPCDEFHALEVFATTNLPETLIYKSSEYENFITDFCSTNIFGYAGIDANLDDYTYSYLGPTEESFAQGDRDIDCVALRVDQQPTTGSIRNIGR